MAEMISSVVVQETVNQIVSGLVHNYEAKEKSNTNENVERLEMAHIRLGAALEISNKWVITDPSLLCWRQKLKRAAQECDDTLHKYKHGILEEKQMEQEVRTSSFPKRIAHATKTFIFSAFSSNEELSRSTIRRFEWFADGASDFLRFAEFGCTPRCHIPFNSLIEHLLAGKELHHKIVRRNEHHLFLSVVPFQTAEHGMEASLVFIQKDGNAPEKNFFLTVILQLSESTDIIGTTIKCLQLYTSHFKCTVEIIKKELTQLPTQDFSWVPYIGSCHKEHWDNLHSFSTQWFRPNPLCCKQHDKQNICSSSRLETLKVPDISLEPVIEVNLQCQVSLRKYNKQRTPPRLKAGLLFTPHGCSEDMSGDKSSPLTAIIGEEQHCLYTDIGLEELGEIMLPMAIDYFHQNAEAIVYQMLWKSKHGAAYIQIEKVLLATEKTFGGGRKRKLLLQQDQEIGGSTHVISHFLNLWAAHVPFRLRGSVADWIQNEKESQLAASDMDR